jgi:hypothetical protein
VKALAVANVAMTVVFLLAVAVQHNDPDPVRWMAIYGLAALACVLRLAGRRARLLPGLIGLVALAWAATLAPGVVGRVSLGDLFESYAMKSAPVEEARELGGLLIVAAWMSVLAFNRPRPSR